MKLVGIQRGTQFSPGRHEDNDRLILEATAAVLQRKGCRIQLLSEDDVVGDTGLHATGVFSMCQGTRANHILEDLERRGGLIINRPTAAQNCYRARLHRVLRGDWGIFAPTVVVSTEGTSVFPPAVAWDAGFWVKRGDVHATQPGDVVRVRSPQEFEDVLDDFRRRDIAEAVVGPHFAGEVIKFYGVIGTPFFRFYCERDFKLCPIDFGAARPSIERIVRRLGLEVYGGDAILTPHGHLRVIDINDWPSFANFRHEAAEIIAAYIFRRAAQHRERLVARERPGLDLAPRPLVQG